MSMLGGLLRRIGRLFEPLLSPRAEEDRRRIDALTTVVKEQGAAIRALTEQMTAERALLQRLRQLRMDDVEEARGAAADLRNGVRRQEAAIGRLARSVGIHAELAWTEQRVVERLARVARSGRPIVVGPWTGEIGFELLYWIPFVRWAVDKFGFAPERITVVSRGGTQSWYGGIGNQYVDVFSMVSPAEFRAATEAVKKQRSMGRFDRDLLRKVVARQGGTAAMIHPALMYALFMPFWKRQAPLSRVTEHARYARIQPAAVAGMPELPSDYVAVRFYFSSCFPDTETNRTLVSDVVASLAERTDVVMLNPGFRVDDHVDFSPGAQRRIHYIDMSARPEENLAWQSAMIAGAKAFVGTYGGFSYLAPLCGVNSLSFLSDRTYFASHLELAHHAFAEIGGGTFTVIDVNDVNVLRNALAAAASVR